MRTGIPALRRRGHVFGAQAGVQEAEPAAAAGNRSADCAAHQSIGPGARAATEGTSDSEHVRSRMKTDRYSPPRPTPKAFGAGRRITGRPRKNIPETETGPALGQGFVAPHAPQPYVAAGAVAAGVVNSWSNQSFNNQHNGWWPNATFGQVTVSQTPQLGMHPAGTQTVS